MSNALAIAGVTAVLKDLLHEGLINQDLSRIGGVTVTAQPPERLAAKDTSAPANQLNLYLYRVTPNPGWVNEGMPARSADGPRLSKNLLALDLCYLLTAYGNEDLNAEILLGFGMQLLHETPVLVRDKIRKSLGAGTSLSAAILPSPFKELDADALADQFEQIRISPYYSDMEEVSRIWSSLNTGLRPSAAYKVTVVLIESKASLSTAPPVKSRQLYVDHLRRPRIERLLSRATPASEPREGAVILHGHHLLLRGSGLRGGSVTVVLVGDRTIPQNQLELTDREISFVLPTDLWSGIFAVQVLHRIGKEAPSVGEIPLEASNTAAFALSPSLVPGPDPKPVELVAPGTPIAGKVKVRFGHKVGVGQKAELLLNEVAVTPPSGRPAHAYTFAAEKPGGNDAEVTELDFPIRKVQPAIYLVRLRIDGALSDVTVASGGGLPANIQALANAGIYSQPALDLSPSPP